MTGCWRCGRTNTEQKPADPALHPDGTVECVDHMDCIRARFDDNKPGPGQEILELIYQTEYRKHRGCDPPCLDLKQAAEHLIASGVDLAEEGP